MTSWAQTELHRLIAEDTHGGLVFNGTMAWIVNGCVVVEEVVEVVVL